LRDAAGGPVNDLRTIIRVNAPVNSKTPPSVLETQRLVREFARKLDGKTYSEGTRKDPGK
jgi:hypothetical protein